MLSKKSVVSGADSGLLCTNGNGTRASWSRVRFANAEWTHAHLDSKTRQLLVALEGRQHAREVALAATPNQAQNHCAAVRSTTASRPT